MKVSKMFLVKKYFWFFGSIISAAVVGSYIFYDKVPSKFLIATWGIVTTLSILTNYLKYHFTQGIIEQLDIKQLPKKEDSNE